MRVQLHNLHVSMISHKLCMRSTLWLISECRPRGRFKVSFSYGKGTMSIENSPSCDITCGVSFLGEVHEFIDIRVPAWSRDVISNGIRYLM